MQIRSETTPGQILGVNKLVTPHGCILVVVNHNGEKLFSIDLSCSDLHELLAESASSLQDEVEHWRLMLNAKIDLKRSMRLVSDFNIHDPKGSQHHLQ